jgi:hypothetical protein
MTRQFGISSLIISRCCLDSFYQENFVGLPKWIAYTSYTFFVYAYSLYYALKSMRIAFVLCNYIPTQCLMHRAFDVSQFLYVITRMCSVN